MPRRFPRGSPILGLMAFALSCGPDDPTAPAAELFADSQRRGSPHLADEDALSIEEMLTDPLFQGSLASISEERLLEPLIAAVDALARGQVARASVLISQASEEADALKEGPLTSSLISWSTLERYFEEAELL